jgi:hypothetical protein
VLSLTQALLPSVPPASEAVREQAPLRVLAAHAAKPQNAERVAFMHDNPHIVGMLANLFLPLLYQIYSLHSAKAVKAPVRLKRLSHLHSCAALQRMW